MLKWTWNWEASYAWALMNKSSIFGLKSLVLASVQSKNGKEKSQLMLEIFTCYFFGRYYPGSFLASPGWVQVKCDLRVLTQFPFNLNIEWELPANKKNVNRQPLKEGVRDMLVKHHLFSWDLWILTSLSFRWHARSYSIYITYCSWSTISLLVCISDSSFTIYLYFNV